MAGRVLLPQYGGTPSVWLTCLLFFQSTVLVGYGYAHFLGTRLSRRNQGILHAAFLLLSLAFLPVLKGPMGDRPQGDFEPAILILKELVVALGIPCMLLAATAPLLQNWFSSRFPGRSGYRLYALSNSGSLLGLAVYPTVSERFLPLGCQATLWSGAFAAFGLACLLLGLFGGHPSRGSIPLPDKPSPRGPSNSSAAPGPGQGSGMRIWFGWMALAFVGSTLLMATTHQLCQYVASVPFLWVLPLGIYLLTFILAFDREETYRRDVFAILMAAAAPVGCAMLAVGLLVSLPVQTLSYGFVLFVGCMICHGELARSKPGEEQSTFFYLSIATGGILGGFFVTVLAPLLFEGYWEYHLALLGCCLFSLAPRLQRNLQPRPSRWVTWVLSGVAWGTAVFLTLHYLSSGKGEVDAARNFYGVVRVVEGEDSLGRFRRMEHGRINHGLQYLDPEHSHEATTYFGPRSGVGMAFRFHPKRHSEVPGDRSLRAAIVGLGAGTLATYGREGDLFRVYEINPEVVRMAKEDFSFLSESRARVETVVGDGRIALRSEDLDEPPYDLIVLDAFSGDATPIHLLTREAFELYRKRLAPEGLLAVNITNRFVDLSSVVRGLSEALGLQGIRIRSERDESLGTQPATWVLLTDNQTFLDNPDIRSAETPWTSEDPAPMVWTDDFSSLWQVLRF